MSANKSQARPVALGSGVRGSLPLALALIGLVLVGACKPGADSAATTRTPDSVAVADDDADSLPPLPPSLLDLPVTYDLAPAVAALEASVPTSFGDINMRKSVPGHDRLQVAFGATRSPFSVHIRGSTATIESIITYQAKGWYKVKFGPEVGGACGTGDESPRLRIALATTVRLARDWSLESSTKVPVVAPATDSLRDRCRVTALRYDVTQRVVEAAQKQLEGKAALVDDRVKRIDVRRRVERWWALLHRPIRIRDSLWLQIRPSEVRMGALRAEGGALVAPLGLTANPRIISGPKPDTTPTVLPQLIKEAPALRTARTARAAQAVLAESDGAIEDDGGLRVIVETELAYPEASHMLAGRIIGKEIERSGQRVKVQGAVVSAAPGGRVALAIHFSGAAEGVAMFLGRPVYDSASGEVRVPDLDFDVTSDNAVLQGLDWLRHDDVRDTLRARARWNMSGLLETSRRKLEEALNRDLSKGVSLMASVPTAKVLDVRARRQAIVMRAAAHGRAALFVDRAPNFGRKKKPVPRPADSVKTSAR